MQLQIDDSKIIIFLDGQSPQIVQDTDERYKSICRAVSEGDQSKVERILRRSPTAEADKKLRKAGIKVKDGSVMIGGKEINEKLAAYIKHYVSTDSPVSHLIAFIKKLDKNPSFRSREQLFNFIEKNSMTICPDGDFLAYKGLNSDYSSIHKDRKTNKSIMNGIGSVIKMPRSEISDDPNSHCSQGLHVGSCKYATNFGRGAQVICKVSPENVVSVPHDLNEKVRVCEYKVIADYDSEISSLFVDKWFKETINGANGTSWDLFQSDVQFDEFEDEEWYG